MKKKMCILTLAVVLLLSMFSQINVNAETKRKSLDVVFLHDLHSHLENFAVVENGETVHLGGMPQMKTVIDTQKDKTGNSKSD